MLHVNRAPWLPHAALRYNGFLGSDPWETFHVGPRPYGARPTGQLTATAPTNDSVTAGWALSCGGDATHTGVQPMAAHSRAEVVWSGVRRRSMLLQAGF